MATKITTKEKTNSSKKYLNETRLTSCNFVHRIYFL